MVYKFDQIAYNITTKRTPTKDDMLTYIGLEHLESGSLDVGSYGSKVEIKGDKLVMTRGDILLGKRNAYLRRAAIAPHDGLFSAHGMVLRPKEDVIDKSFFPFFIASDIFFDEAVRISVGGLSPTINWKDLKEVEFTLPSLSEQKVLADKLWAAYRVKESYKKLLAATDDMLKAKFQEMFIGQGVVALSVACDIVMGTSPDSQYYNTNCEGLPFYQGKTEFTDMYIGGAEVWCTKPVRVAEKDEILMSVRAPVGAINIAAEKCCIGRGLCSLKPKDNVTKLLFVFYALKLQEEKISRLGTGSTFKAINKDQVYNKITLPLPPLPFQQQFVEIATQAEATKESLRKSIENIDQVIKSLINQ